VARVGVTSCHGRLPKAFLLLRPVIGRQEVTVEALREASLVRLFALLISVAPMLLGIAIAVRPQERWLALMRPLTLAGVFAAVSGIFLGLVNTFIGLTNVSDESARAALAPSMAESSLLAFLAFGCLTVAWLGVTIGLRRQQA
jgi:hypothetical protein